MKRVYVCASIPCNTATVNQGSSLVIYSCIFYYRIYTNVHIFQSSCLVWIHSNIFYQNIQQNGYISGYSMWTSAQSKEDFFRICCSP